MNSCDIGNKKTINIRTTHFLLSKTVTKNIHNYNNIKMLLSAVYCLTVYEELTCSSFFYTNSSPGGSALQLHGSGRRLDGSRVQTASGWLQAVSGRLQMASGRLQTAFSRTRFIGITASSTDPPAVPLANWMKPLHDDIGCFCKLGASIRGNTVPVAVTSH